MERNERDMIISVDFDGKKAIVEIQEKLSSLISEIEKNVGSLRELNDYIRYDILLKQTENGFQNLLTHLEKLDKNRNCS